MREIADELNVGLDSIAFLDDKPAERERVRKLLEKRAEEKAAAFRTKWTKTFDKPGAENWWTGYLARNARPPSARVG